MNNCGSIVASGLGNCKAYLKRFKAGVVSTRGTTFTAAELATTTKLKTLLSADAGITALYLPFKNYTRNTDAPDIQTSPLGLKDVYDDRIPSGLAHLDIGFSDYKTLWGMNNTLVDLILITNDGKLAMTPTGSGGFKGFRCKVYSEKDFSNFDNYQESAPLHIFFTDVAEFENMVVMDMNFPASDIEDLVPVGLDIVQTSAVTSGDCTVKVTLRGSGTGKAGLTDWDILDSNVDTPSVTAVDDGGGVYTLTSQKGSSPADIADGDWITVQGKVVAATFVTYITPPIKIKK